jgi:desampylase
MKALWISQEHRQAIAAASRAAVPHEACGVLLGAMPSDDAPAQVVQVIAAPNIAATPATHYEIDPVVLVQAWQAAESQDMTIIGFWHSHTQGPALPSPTDIRQATYPNLVYVIAGVADSKTQLTAWHLRDGTATSVPLLDPAIDPPPPSDAPQPQAIGGAMLVSAVLLILLLVLVSFGLLPPAPPPP